MLLHNITEVRTSVLSYIEMSFDATISRRALVDAGACENLIMKTFYQELVNAPRTRHLVEKYEARKAIGSRVKVIGEVFVTFKFAQLVFREPFLILETTTPITLGRPVFC